VIATTVKRVNGDIHHRAYTRRRLQSHYVTLSKLHKPLDAVHMLSFCRPYSWVCAVFTAKSKNIIPWS